MSDTIEKLKEENEKLTEEIEKLKEKHDLELGLERGYLWESLEFIGDHSGICPFEEVRKLKEENKKLKRFVFVGGVIEDEKVFEVKCLKEEIKSVCDKYNELLSLTTDLKEEKDRLNEENHKLSKDIEEVKDASDSNRRVGIGISCECVELEEENEKLKRLTAQYSEFISDQDGIFCRCCDEAFNTDDVTDVDEGDDQYCDECLQGLKARGEVSDCEECGQYVSKENIYICDAGDHFCSERCRKDAT
jgi:hypothetical protein